jgi:predicted nucleotidyltransferase
LKDFIVKTCYPKSIVLFGSYFRGEDIEGSDIDICLFSNSSKQIDFSEFERILCRKINVLQVKNISDLDLKIQNKIKKWTCFMGGNMNKNSNYFTKNMVKYINKFKFIPKIW